jgi:hypothetical protein
MSRTGGFLGVDLAVQATTIDQDLSNYVGRGVELVPSHAASPVALAPRMTCLSPDPRCSYPPK